MPKARRSQESNNNPKRISSRNVNFIIKLVIVVVFVNVSVLSVLAYMISRPDEASDFDVVEANVIQEDREQPVITPQVVRNNQEPNEDEAEGDDENDYMREVVEADKIYENIFIGGVDVGGLTKEEAFTKLTNELTTPLEENTVSYIKDSESTDFTFADFGVTYNLIPAINEAYDYAKSGSLIERYGMIMDLRKTAHEIEVKFEYDEEKLTEIIDKIAAKYNVPVVNATISRSNGKFTYTDAKHGLSVNKDTLSSETSAILLTENSGTVTINMYDVAPKFTASDLQNSTSLLSSFTTYFSAGVANRNNNIFVAASKINNNVVLPGGVFSTGKAFGPSTEANGYKYAGSYLAGELVQSIGGGMCQVSSTLYSALLYAELEIVERRNHSMAVGYVDGGMDATLAENWIDLRFRNNTAYPVIIEAITTGTSVTVNIYGHETRDPNRSIKLVSELVELIPTSENVVEDPTLPLGQRVVEVNGSPGGRYRLHKVIYQNGVEIDRVLVNTSNYNPMQTKVRLGTKPLEAESENLAENLEQEEILTEEVPVTETPVVENPAEETQTGESTSTDTEDTEEAPETQAVEETSTEQVEAPAQQTETEPPIQEAQETAETEATEPNTAVDTNTEADNHEPSTDAIEDIIDTIEEVTSNEEPEDISAIVGGEHTDSPFISEPVIE